MSDIAHVKSRERESLRSLLCRNDDLSGGSGHNSCKDLCPGTRKACGLQLSLA